MIDLPIHPSEVRLDALAATGLLDAPAAPAFDRVTALAQRLLDVPVSLVSLVDRDRQFFLSAAGLDGPWAEARETPLSHSFCRHVVDEEGPIRVENAPFDPAFCDNLAIRDLDVVGYLGVPIRTPGGAVLGSLCAITPYPRAWTDADVATLTELGAIVEAEVALQEALRAEAAEADDRREAVEELQVALDAAHLGRWEIDLDTGLVTQDPRARAIHGLGPDRTPVPYTAAVATIHSADRDEAVAAYQAVIAGGVGGRFAREYRVVHADGDVRWVRAAGQVRRGARGARLVGVAWDVTDEREAAAALRRSGRRKALLLRLLGGHRQSSDPRTMMAAAAEALGRHLGAHRVGLYRLADDDTADFDSGPVWTDGTLPPLGGRFPVVGMGEGLAARLRAGETVAVDDVATDPLTEGSAFPEIGTRAQIGAPIVRGGVWTAGLYVHHAAPRAWTDDEVALVRDVADQVWDAVERAEAEDAVRALNDELEGRVAERTAELERSNAELDQFAYVASHDLKAPIRAIDSLAAWIAEDAGDALPEGSTRHLGLLRSRAARMERLLDSLLTYSRVGRQETAPEPIESGAVVRDAVEMVAPPEGFDVRLEGDFPVVVAARAPFELVFRNLIGNAIKHHDRPDGRVTVSAEAADGWGTFTVADDGPGIDPAYQDRIFGLFQTLRPRDEVEGSGMGLSIVKKVVESRGGSVAVASDGRGTTFRVRWPLAPREA